MAGFSINKRLGNPLKGYTNLGIVLPLSTIPKFVFAIVFQTGKQISIGTKVLCVDIVLI